MNASGVLGCDIPFFRFDRPTSPLAKTATRISSLSSGLYENRTFPSPPQTPILGLGELAIFPLANKETNKCPGVYPWSGFFIRGFVRKPDVLHAYALFLAFPFSLSFFISRIGGRTVSSFTSTSGRRKISCCTLLSCCTLKMYSFRSSLKNTGNSGFLGVESSFSVRLCLTNSSTLHTAFAILELPVRVYTTPFTFTTSLIGTTLKANTILPSSYS